MNKCNLKAIKAGPTLVMGQVLTNNKRHLSKFFFERYGITGTAQCISRLKSKGAIIETVYRTEIDNYGKSHNRIACYKIVGWIQ